MGFEKQALNLINQQKTSQRHEQNSLKIQASETQKGEEEEEEEKQTRGRKLKRYLHTEIS